MLGEIFYWIFNMSIAAAICGGAVLLLRLIKKMPRRVAVWLWCIPFFRMCVPVGITGKYGLMSFLAKFTTKTVTVYEFSDGVSLSFMNHTMAANNYFPVQYKVNLLEDIFAVGAVIWLTVAVALLIAFLSIYFVTVQEMKSAVPLGDGVYLSDKIRTPAVYGILRPKIVLPHAYEEQTLRYILLHERAHIKRRDNLVRVLAFAAVCVHWFNPLCWLFLKCLYTDMELACDETVLAPCDAEQKKEYARALVSSAEKTNVFVSAFGGARIRTRIENILSYKRMSALSAVGFSVLLLAIAYILLTNAS